VGGGWKESLIGRRDVGCDVGSGKKEKKDKKTTRRVAVLVPDTARIDVCGADAVRCAVAVVVGLRGAFGSDGGAKI
jgi:hypothetical protein